MLRLPDWLLLRNSSLERQSNSLIKQIEEAFILAKKQKPVYSDWYPLLEPFFIQQAQAKHSLTLTPPEISDEIVRTKWQEGFPLLRRWDFPLDTAAAERVLLSMADHIPKGNEALKAAHSALVRSLASHSTQREAFWRTFLHHEEEPEDTWVDIEEADFASILFWGRGAIRPSLEFTAQNLQERFPIPKEWFKGYCPICGSLPSMLYLMGQGERRACCSWCGTEWGLHRLQCPYCDNRNHESLGYITPEDEPQYRIQYCRICGVYFKLIDTRDRIDPVYFPLEEWTTLHLDLLAQEAGWKQALSPSPVVYGRAVSS
jgi:FdhE protein